LKHITHSLYRQCLVIGLSITLSSIAASSWAQRLGHESNPLTDPELSEDTLSEEELAPVLPPLPELPAIPPDEQRLSAAPSVRVEKFIFEGNQVFDEATLSEVVAEYTQRLITAEELQAAKNAITQFYIDAGYINSGAIIPDQRVANNEIKLKIIEGQLSEIEVINNKRVRESYLTKRIDNPKDKALNIIELQKRLQLLHQNPLFKRINAELGPGIELGEGILRIKVEEEKPYEIGVDFNNHRSPSIGAYRGEVYFLHRNVTGLLGQQNGIGDSLFLRYGLTEGLNDYSFGYSLPINSLIRSGIDTTFSLNIERSDAEVVEEPYNDIDIESEADTISFGISQPLWKQSDSEFSLGLRFDRRTSQTFLLGEPFAFSRGVGDDGQSKVSVIRFTQDWLQRSRVQVLAARSSLNFGVDVFDATVNENDEPDSKFFSWLGQFQWVRRVPVREINTQLLFRTDLQWANEDLLPLEKFSVGGNSTVRGYRENQLTRDNGWIVSLEWRVDMPFKWRLGRLSKNPEDGLVQLAPFIDYGRSWNADSETPDPKDISSVGLGLRWLPSKHVQAEVYWGHALRNLEEPEDDDLQDDGVHFELRFRL